MDHQGFSRCLFNVCTPNYARWYRVELESQKKYAQKHRFDYQPVLLSGVRAGEAKWDKLKQLLSFLHQYHVVLLLDADCLVRENAPDICTQLVKGKSIYMARGVSNRFNSGVILAVSHERSKAFFEAVIAARGQRLRPENVVSAQGENGHVIEMATDPSFSDIVRELSYHWNNNRFPNAPDYIRHYCGPMKKRRKIDRHPHRYNRNT